MAMQRLQYIHNNPVVAGFVEKGYDWLWSSCANYEKYIKDKIEIINLE